jgi:hypothetical protein
MTIIDYKQDTGKFTIHISDVLDEAHVELLKRFEPSEKYDRVEFSMDELFKQNDEDDWRESHQLYWDLSGWGFLEEIYDHHDNKQVSRLTELGRILLNKINGKPQRNQK